MKESLNYKVSTFVEASKYAEHYLYRVASGKPDLHTLECAMASVLAMERSLRAVRSAIRSRWTKAKRAACVHPLHRRFVYTDGSARCVVCGLKYKHGTHDFTTKQPVTPSEQ